MLGCALKNVNTAKSGFSLVELSIVLVILGLLTGGILTGQSLIRAAEIRSVSTDFQRYQAALNTFRDKYFALPGDMRNATDFWGTFSNGTCNTGSGIGTETCNGNGNGSFENGGANVAAEHFLFWQHMANAGLIEGSYTGKAGSIGGIDHIFGENAPQSRVNNAGWQVRNTGSLFGDSFWFDGDHGHVLRIGGRHPTDGEPKTAFLSPEEALNIDTKIDDGRPGSGQTVVLHSTACSNATGSTDLSAEYALSTTSLECSMVFRNMF